VRARRQVHVLAAPWVEELVLREPVARCGSGEGVGERLEPDLGGREGALLDPIELDLPDDDADPGLRELGLRAPEGRGEADQQCPRDEAEDHDDSEDLDQCQRATRPAPCARAMRIDASHRSTSWRRMRGSTAAITTVPTKKESRT